MISLCCVLVAAVASCTFDSAADPLRGGEVPDDIIIGDPVGLDRDRDTVPDDVDNCPENANPSQSDMDGDGLGDACD
jgi:hypothetical protein